MSELSLIELLTSYSWAFVDVCLIENPIFKVCITYTHIFLCLSKWGISFTFMTGPGPSHLSHALIFSGMIFIPNVMKTLLFVQEVQHSRSS
jgi:hypothetical protein